MCEEVILKLCMCSLYDRQEMVEQGRLGCLQLGGSSRVGCVCVGWGYGLSVTSPNSYAETLTPKVDGISRGSLGEGLSL